MVVAPLASVVGKAVVGLASAAKQPEAMAVERARQQTCLQRQRRLQRQKIMNREMADLAETCECYAIHCAVRYLVQCCQKKPRPWRPVVLAIIKEGSACQ